MAMSAIRKQVEVEMFVPCSMHLRHMLESAYLQVQTSFVLLYVLCLVIKHDFYFVWYLSLSFMAII